MFPPLLVAVRVPVTFPEPKFSAPVEIAVNAPVVSVPSVSALTSVMLVAPPVRVTVPRKSFWLARVIPARAPTGPAVTLTVPVPELIVVPLDWVMAPAAVSISRVPAPADPIVTCPRRSVFASRTEILPIPEVVRATALVKLLSSVSVMFPADAVTVVVPGTTNAPS